MDYTLRCRCADSKGLCFETQAVPAPLCYKKAFATLVFFPRSVGSFHLRKHLYCPRSLDCGKSFDSLRCKPRHRVLLLRRWKTQAERAKKTSSAKAFSGGRVSRRDQGAQQKQYAVAWRAMQCYTPARLWRGLCYGLNF